MPRGSQLRDGDVVHEDDHLLIVVAVPAIEVWVVAGQVGPASLLAAAVELGNLHLPVEITPAGELVILSDGPALTVLRRHGLTHEVANRRFAPLKAMTGGDAQVAAGFRILRSAEPT